MAKVKWVTPDDYHIQDIIDMGRCLWCGGLAQAVTTHHGHAYNHCSAECSACLNAVFDELDKDDVPEPNIDDAVRACPNCETPNQFGELCDRCRREEEEYYIQNPGSDRLADMQALQGHEFAG